MGRSSAEATRSTSYVFLTEDFSHVTFLGNDLANCMDILLDVLQPSDLTESLLANQQVFQKDVTVLDKEINCKLFHFEKSSLHFFVFCKLFRSSWTF